MRVGLHDADSHTGYPNLALMKLSAYHRANGHHTELWSADRQYDKVYSSKVFTFTPETAPPAAELGGYGRGLIDVLPYEIEHICPDYDLYGIEYSMGFLTRGCPNKCPACFVPQKEGELQPHADYTEFVRHPTAVFMDNNVLASDWGIWQIERLAAAGVRCDFNQGLDARFIDDAVARRLGALKWLVPLRLACDSKAAMEPVRRAVELLRWHNVTPSRYFCYVLAHDVESTLERVRFLKGIYVDPFVQPFIPPSGEQPSLELRQLARWVNTKMLFKSMSWSEYLAERGPDRA